VILADGTGQAGGLRPDQRLSNVYKLYRATRGIILPPKDFIQPWAWSLLMENAKPPVNLCVRTRGARHDGQPPIDSAPGVAQPGGESQ
jgi:hypothetical protein